MSKKVISQMDPQRRRVGMLLGGNEIHHREVALGIVEYQRAHREWELIGDGFNPLIPWSQLNQFEGDGLVAIANTREQIAALKSLKIPVVLAGARFLNEGFNVVASDNRAIGEMAAHYLLDCGLKQFLYIGSLTWDDEKLRHEGFKRKVAEKNCICKIADAVFGEYVADDMSTHYQAEIESLVSEFQESILPFGVFCPNTIIARAAIFACQRAQMKIPDQVAILAVNDDPLECETSTPPISTVVQSSRQIGYRAAERLSALMNGEKFNTTDQSQFIQPMRISIRKSTEVRIVNDEMVESALRIISKNATGTCDVADIAEKLDVSRRTLELRFKKVIGRTPGQEITRSRIEIAKGLLSDTQLPIVEVAIRSGFSSSQVFNVTFKKECNTTPKKYREFTQTEFERS